MSFSSRSPLALSLSGVVCWSTAAFVLGLDVGTYRVHSYLTIWTYHHCCDDPRGAAAFSALHLAARRSVSGTMGSCRDFCACTILQSSCCLGAIIMAALRCTEIHWTWKRLKTRAIHGKEPNVIVCHITHCSSVSNQLPLL